MRRCDKGSSPSPAPVGGAQDFSSTTTSQPAEMSVWAKATPAMLPPAEMNLGELRRTGNVMVVDQVGDQEATRFGPPGSIVVVVRKSPLIGVEGELSGGEEIGV
uniref:Uncharacterized protein n=1 Tax=Cannabis sativa TaxID=3483 RepID=A0A803Q340_CANSA